MFSKTAHSSRTQIALVTGPGGSRRRSTEARGPRGPQSTRSRAQANRNASPESEMAVPAADVRCTKNDREGREGREGHEGRERGECPKQAQTTQKASPESEMAAQATSG